MLDRELVLTTIDNAYAARIRGDKAELAKYWSEDASFRISGDPSPFRSLIQEGDEPMRAVGELIDCFHFSDVTRLSAVVEGNHAAIRWEVTVTTEGKAPVRTELMDLIQLGEDGRIQSFVQFVDTAVILRMLQ